MEACLRQLKATELAPLDKSVLTEFSAAVLDTGTALLNRSEKVLEMLGNPYCFRVGDIAVKLEFNDDAPSLQDCLAAYFIRKKAE